ncbi:MAG: hypothetical protein JKY65_32315, partial [Planctomycetes bacterium]|nr:hypothetical protein [Planctomycetota bacterium]
MLVLEDLYVASQAKRYQLIDVERLRALLVELAAQPERVQLVRVLHDRFSLPLEQSKGLYDQAVRYLRQRTEERYAQLLKRGLPPEDVDALAQEQAAAGFSWTLAERLLPEGKITQQQHVTIQAEVQRQLAEEDGALVTKNLKYSFGPILGPPPNSKPDLATSGQLPNLVASSAGDFDALGEEVTLRLPAGGLAQALPAQPQPQAAGAEEDGLKTMELDRPMNLGQGAPPQPPSGSFVRPLGGPALQPPPGMLAGPAGFGPPDQSTAPEADELGFDVAAPTLQLEPGAVARAIAASGLSPAP